MRKGRILGIMAVVGLFAVSCQDKELNVENSAVLSDAPVYYASMERVGDSESKVYVDENLMVLWNADDRVSIFEQYTYNRQYRFTGETGANAGSFERVPTDEYVTGNAIPAHYAVYPYSPSTSISNDCILSLTLPETQTYSENGFGPGVNTMVSATEDKDLLFRNLGGYLAFKLYGDNVSVSKLTLRGNGAEKLAGKGTVTAPLGGEPTAEMADDASCEVTITCADPVMLGASEADYTEFWFVVPPTLFSEGFTLTVEDKAGRVFSHSTNQSIEITRNHLSRMSPIEVIPEGPQLVRLNASFYQVDTKAELQDLRSLLWSAKDRITVYTQKGESAVFISENNGPSYEAVFSGYLDLYSSGDMLWARYPASSYDFADGQFAGKLNAVQKAVENGFDPDSQLFVAQSDNESLTFHNAFTYLGISVANDDIVSVTLKANNGEAINGGCLVSIDSEGKPSLEMVSSGSGSDEVLLYDPKGNPLVPNSKYFFTLPPCTLTTGLTLILQNSAGQFAKKTTTREIALVPNSIIIMSVTGTLTFEDAQTNELTVAEISGLPDGTAVATRPLLVTAKTTYGLMLNDDSGDIFLYGRYLEAVVGDRVKIQAVKKTFRGLPEMADMTSCIILSHGNAFSYPQATDLTDLETVDYDDPLFGGFSYVSITASYINADLDVRNYAAYNLRFHKIDPSINHLRLFYPYDYQKPSLYSPDDEISVTGYFGGFDDTQKIVYIIPTSMTK